MANLLKVIVITGPTASGKTALSIQLAQYYKTEIISCDARQCYEKMHIGTASPTLIEQQQAKHHLINHVPLDQTYSAGIFATEAFQLLQKLSQFHTHVIVVGGSGLYLKALCEGLHHFPTIPHHIRTKLNQTYQEKGLTPLLKQLSQVDPLYYAKTDLKNPRRVIRALEIFEATGTPYSTLLTAQKQPCPAYHYIKIGLTHPTAILYERINLRVEEMIKAGLLEEAQRLYLYNNTPALNTIGYKELFDYFENKYSLDEAIKKIKQNTRNFAKRQLTWWRKDNTIQWFQQPTLEELQRHIALHK